jgi:hypothetical protein
MDRFRNIKILIFIQYQSIDSTSSWQKYEIKLKSYTSKTTFGKHIKYFVTGFDNAFKCN